MARMTKAQARKRLTEARIKIEKVMLAEFMEPKDGHRAIPHRINKDLMAARNLLGNVRNKI